jgi:hypothetical protein
MTSELDWANSELRRHLHETVATVRSAQSDLVMAATPANVPAAVATGLLMKSCHIVENMVRDENPSPIMLDAAVRIVFEGSVVGRYMLRAPAADGRTVCDAFSADFDRLRQLIPQTAGGGPPRTQGGDVKQTKKDRPPDLLQLCGRLDRLDGRPIGADDITTEHQYRVFNFQKSTFSIHATPISARVFLRQDAVLVKPNSEPETDEGALTSSLAAALTFLCEHSRDVLHAFGVADRYELLKGRALPPDLDGPGVDGVVGGGRIIGG